MATRSAGSRVKEELAAWQRETGRALPRDAQEIMWLESAGAVVDLVTGEVFRPVDRWGDFATRWATEQTRVGCDLDAARLAAALRKASGHGFAEKVCAAIAAQVLPAVAGDGCTPMPTRESAAMTGRNGSARLSASARSESRC